MRLESSARNGAARSFETATLALAGTEVVADRSGALYMPRDRTLVVADLHLEKGSAFATRGVMLPPYDTRETLLRLAAVVTRYRPARVIALGDSLHDRDAAERIEDGDRASLRGLQRGREWIWITGNHDRQIPPEIGGQFCDSIETGALVLRHEPSPLPSAREIAGHLHPAARVLLSGTGLRSRCFVAGPSRMVLPAFGAFTGGLNVLDEAVASLFCELGSAVYLLGRDGVYPVAATALCPD